jgi:uncharacterized protein
MTTQANPTEQATQRFQFGGLGTVYSYTLLQEVPAGYEEQAPYLLALVKLDEGPLVTAQITDAGAEGVAIGDRVEMVTRKLTAEGNQGMIVYGYKFRKLLK